MDMDMVDMDMDMDVANDLIEESTEQRMASYGRKDVRYMTVAWVDPPAIVIRFRRLSVGHALRMSLVTAAGWHKRTFGLYATAPLIVLKGIPTRLSTRNAAKFAV